MVKHENKKLIVLMTGGPISELGFITGPVLHPWYVDIDTVIRLVSNNKRVYEVNPNNRDERVLLTLKNVRLNNFGKKETAKTVEPIQAEVKKEVPVVETKKEEVKPDMDTIVEPEQPTNDFRKKR